MKNNTKEHYGGSARGDLRSPLPSEFGPLLPAPWIIFLNAPKINFQCSLNHRFSLPAPCVFFSFAPWIQFKALTYINETFKSISGINCSLLPKSLFLPAHVLFDAMLPAPWPFYPAPRPFWPCSLLPKLISFAPCSPAFWEPCSLLPGHFDPILPAPKNPLAEPHYGKRMWTKPLKNMKDTSYHEHYSHFLQNSWKCG